MENPLKELDATRACLEACYKLQKGQIRGEESAIGFKPEVVNEAIVFWKKVIKELENDDGNGTGRREPDVGDEDIDSWP